MKYFYIVMGVLLALLILGILLVQFRRWRARKLVRSRSDEEKYRDLNDAIGPFGFQYDICQELFYAMKNGWQREMGYSRIYDDNAIRLGMVIDSEPFYFKYGGRNYLLEIWKGQYGLTTGAEIGLYVSDEESKEPEKLFYQSVTDAEMVGMRFVLRKGDRILMIRDEKHWWLTGFLLGEFSRPEELEMDVAITFADYRMRNAFYDAMLDAGYSNNEIYVDGAQVRFVFAKPRTIQPKHWKIRVRFAQWLNKRFCKKYFRATGWFTRTLDRVDYLGMCFPFLYRMLGRLSRQKKKRKAKA